MMMMMIFYDGSTGLTEPQLHEPPRRALPTSAALAAVVRRRRMRRAVVGVARRQLVPGRRSSDGGRQRSALAEQWKSRNGDQFPLEVFGHAHHTSESVDRNLQCAVVTPDHHHNRQHHHHQSINQSIDHYFFHAPKH